jgi:hypothetical protein
MAESKEELEKRLLEELKGKNVAHYSVMLGAWMQTKMEHDKTLVTLSFGGIALLLTIINLTGVWSIWTVLLFLGSFTGFVLTIACALIIYERNATHIESELRGDHRDFKLAQLDKFLKYTFLVGAVCAILASTISMWSKQMTRAKITTAQDLSESLKGIENLGPAGEVKSLSGIENLKPQVVNPASTQPTTSGTAQTQSPAEQPQTDKPK